MNRYQGLTAGFEAGEVFMTYRSVGVDDLMRGPARRMLGRDLSFRKCRGPVTSRRADTSMDRGRGCTRTTVEASEP